MQQKKKTVGITMRHNAIGLLMTDLDNAWENMLKLQLNNAISQN